MTDSTKAAVVAMLRAAHQAIEAAMHLLNEQAEPQKEPKRMPPVLGGGTDQTARPE